MSASTSLHTDLALAYRTTRPLYRSHDCIGTRPLGQPSRNTADELRRLLELDSSEIEQYGDRDQMTWAIEDLANRILNDLCAGDLETDRQFYHWVQFKPVHHRFHNTDFHQFRIEQQGIINSWSDVEGRTAIGKISATMQSARMELAFDAYRSARTDHLSAIDPKHPDLTKVQPVISHPAFLINSAMTRTGDEDMLKSFRHHTGQIKIPGYSRNPSSITILKPVPDTVCAALAGQPLSTLIELPSVLDETEQAAWDSLTISHARSRPPVKDSKGNPIGGHRTTVFLEPAFPLMVDPEPGNEAPEWQAAWRNVAELVHPL